VRRPLEWLGLSGGAIQQYQIADNYPGLLDGLITGRSFMDSPFASSVSSGDSRLLLTYFDKNAGVRYTDEQKRAIAGFGTVGTISNLSRVRAPRFNATERCPEGLAAELRYHPVNNPKGARCTIWDHGRLRTRLKPASRRAARQRRHPAG
jgi:hypothetical protein